MHRQRRHTRRPANQDEAWGNSWSLGCPQCRHGAGLLIPKSHLREHHHCEEPDPGMPRHEEPPKTAADLSARDLFQKIYSGLKKAVVGHEHALRTLSILGTQFLRGVPRQRGLIIGDPGIGKTTMARALVEVLGDTGEELGRDSRPISTVVDFSAPSETNWRGNDLSGYLEGLYDAANGDRDRLERNSVILIDEMDKGGLRGHGHDSVAASYRLGKMQSILGLWGAGVDVPFSEGRRRFRSDWSLIIGFGVFEGLPKDRPPTPQELVEWGLIPELVSRVGRIIRLGRPSPSQVRRAIEARVTDAKALINEFGYLLKIDADAIARLAHAVADGVEGTDIRSAGDWLVHACDKRLLEEMERGLEPGLVVRVSREDIHLPEPASPRLVGF